MERGKYLAELSSRGTKSINALPHKRDSKIRIDRHMLGAKIQNNKNNKQKEKQTEKKRRKNKNQNTNT